MEYPEGAIKSYEELCKFEGKRELFIDAPHEIYGASNQFHSVMGLRNTLGLKLATLMDHNIPKNGYNDWFLFVDEVAAKRYAGVE